MPFDYLKKRNFKLDLDNKYIKIKILFQMEKGSFFEGALMESLVIFRKVVKGLKAVLSPVLI